MTTIPRGIITMAYGKQRYIDLAKILGQSFKLYNPQLPAAIVTDSTDPELKQLYDIFIPVNCEFGNGFKQKIHLDSYSPFEETIFIDSDCVVVKNIDYMWEIFSAVPFGVIREEQLQEGSAFWNTMPDVAKILSQFKIDSISTFNGGFYYFKNNEKAKKVFTEARKIADNYNQIGLASVRGSSNDEPIYSIALAVCGISGVDDRGLVMRTPVKMIGNLEIDVLKGFCRLNSNGKPAQPAIMHFCGNQSQGFYYRREQLKLYLAKKFPNLDRNIISTQVNLIFSPIYPVAVLNKTARRTVKKLLFPSLPQA